MEVLIRQIDPDGNGHITFSMFRDGIETYLTREREGEGKGEGREREGRGEGEGREWGGGDAREGGSGNFTILFLRLCSQSLHK